MGPKSVTNPPPPPPLEWIRKKLSVSPMHETFPNPPPDTPFRPLSLKEKYRTKVPQSAGNRLGSTPPNLPVLRGPGGRFLIGDQETRGSHCLRCPSADERERRDPLPPFSGRYFPSRLFLVEVPGPDAEGGKVQGRRGRRVLGWVPLSKEGLLDVPTDVSSGRVLFV